MNVVFPPALASLLAAAADGLLCLEGTCLVGWAWTLVALTILSAAVVQRWHAGGDDGAGPHLLRVSPAPADAAALLPRLPGVAPQGWASSARHVAEPAAACPSLRAPPPKFERAVVAVPDVDPAGIDLAPSSPLAHRPDGSSGNSRSPGTPTVPDCPASSGRNPPG
jgi:hypothetical protein